MRGGWGVVGMGGDGGEAVGRPGSLPGPHPPPAPTPRRVADYRFHPQDFRASPFLCILEYKDNW